MASQTKYSAMNQNKKQLLAVLAIVLFGVGVGAYLLGVGPSKHEDDHGHGAPAHEDHKAAPVDAKVRMPENPAESAATRDPSRDPAASSAKGPNGGKLFVKAGYGLEFTIFETGVAPEFRIYTYKDGQPLAPTLSKVTTTIKRLGREPQSFGFTPERDYLKGNSSVDEPHSFAVQIQSLYGGVTHTFKYNQVEARVTLTDAQMRSSGVEVTTVGPASIKSMVQLMGEVGLNLDRAVQVVPRLTGLVESASISVGDRVRRGQVLAVISSQSLAEQRSELLATGKRLALARATFDREKTLWEEKISAKQDYLQAQQALQEAEIAEQLARQKLASLGGLTSGQGRLTSYEIRSPIDGLVTTKKISVGEVVKEDTNIFTVADLSTVWIELNIYAKDINIIKPGQNAVVKATAFDASAAGKVAYVGALIGNQTRTAPARIVLQNPKGVWHPGLPVTVDIVAEEVEVPLAVSIEALQTLGDRQVAFGRYGDYFEAKPVVTGRSDGKMVEIINGLQLGEQVAARNSYVLKADIGKSSAAHDH